MESTAGLESLFCGRTGFHLPLVINRSFRPERSLRQDSEGVCVVLFFVNRGFLFTSHLTVRGFALEPPVLPVALVCAEVTPGSRARQRVNTRGDYGAVRVNGLRL